MMVTKEKTAPTETDAAVRCRICGAVRINTSSGSVCPDNLSHGRVQPIVSDSEANRARLNDFAKSLPEAVGYESRTGAGRKITLYRVAGTGGLRIGRRVKRLPDARQSLGPSEQLAKLAGCVYYFYPHELLEVRQ